MPGVTTKICGIADARTLDAAVAARARYLGFVVHPRSPRHLELDAAAALARRLPDEVTPVVVVVDPDDALIAAIGQALPQATIQLHGSEPPARVAAIARRVANPLWRAIGIRTRDDLRAAGDYRGLVERVLYDAKPPAGAAIPGGLGMRFDWGLLAGATHPLPWMLSGGLDAGNVREAIATTGARSVDVSSGVESAPGVKDVDKVAAFLKAASQS